MKRIEALSTFLADFTDGKAQGRYLPAMLPQLPFANSAFELALCSFLFFLRPERHSIPFHVDGLTELVRVAREFASFLSSNSMVASRTLQRILTNHSVQKRSR
jgi:hypothetical protein